MVSLRFDQGNGLAFVYKSVEKFNGVLSNALESRFEYLIATFLKSPSNIKLLKEIKSTYRKIKNYDASEYHYHFPNNKVQIPYEIAKVIMLDCKNYPKSITVLAEKACRLFANEHVKPIGEIAKNEKWFDYK